MQSGFALNEILAIGSNVWQTACGWGSFSYHEVRGRIYAPRWPHLSGIAATLDERLGGALPV